MRYLGIEPMKPRIAVFDFTGCEGCELQLANAEETLVPFLKAVEVVNFREISSARGDDYDVAIIDGAITRDDEVERIRAIRARAKVLVAIGACACFGGVNRLKHACDPDLANRLVYGDHPKETGPARAVSEIVPVDVAIPGCPVSKAEVERAVRALALGVPFGLPVYPVCVECKHSFTVCLFEKGILCLGPVSRAGCGAPCPAGGLGCWGCRGPADAPNFKEFNRLAREGGFPEDIIEERFAFFGGFKDRHEKG